MKVSDAKVLTNRELCPGVFEMTLDVSLENAAPGMFVQVKIPDAPQLLLNRPLSIHCYRDGLLTLVYQVKGEGTRTLSLAAAGTHMSILGPLGHGFEIPHGKRVTLVGGGMGAAPLRYIAEYDRSNRYTAVLGFRSAGFVFGTERYAELTDLTVLTEDGSAGLCGRVTDVLTADTDEIMACGPLPMLKAVQRFCLDNGVKAQLSLEERMGCGIGACLVCACRVKTADGTGMKRVCADGPVFDASEVIL